MNGRLGTEPGPGPGLGPEPGLKLLSLRSSAVHTDICTLLLFEFVDTITLMDMDIDYSFYAACCSCLSGPAATPTVRIMIISIILMRHFMSRNGIEIEWLVTASSLWRHINGPRLQQHIHDGPKRWGISIISSSNMSMCVWGMLLSVCLCVRVCVCA